MNNEDKVICKERRQIEKLSDVKRGCAFDFDERGISSTASFFLDD
jgi:hypothetical protein